MVKSEELSKKNKRGEKYAGLIGLTIYC